MGDIIKIINYFEYFDDILEGPIFNKEELYTTLNSKDKNIDLINDIHVCILQLFIKDYQINKASVGIDKRINILFEYLCKSYFKKSFLYFNLKNIWQLFIYELFNIDLYNELIDQRSKKYLLESVNNSYWELSIEKKIIILDNLMTLSFELKSIKDEFQNKIQKLNNKTKSKTDLNNDIQNLNKEISNLNSLLSDQKNEYNKLLKENTDDINSFDKIKHVKKLTNMEKSIENYKKEISQKELEIEKIFFKLKHSYKYMELNLNYSIVLGRDIYDYEYIYFKYYKKIIFVRNIVNDKMYIIDNEENLNYLLNIYLDSRGKKQISLINNIRNLIKNKNIEFSKNKNDKSNQEILDFNFSKSLEYESIYNLNDLESDKILTRRQMEDYREYDNLQSKFYELLSKMTYEFNSIEYYIDCIKFLEQNFSKNFGQYNYRWGDKNKVETFYKKLYNEKNILNLKDLLLELNTEFHKLEYIVETEEDETNKKEESHIIIDDDDSSVEINFKKKKKSKDDIYIYNIPFNNYKVKNISSKPWGFYNENIKQSWINFTEDISCIQELYISIAVIIQNIMFYIKKKMKKNEEDALENNRIQEIENLKNMQNNNDISTRTKRRLKRELMNLEENKIKKRGR